MEMYLIATRRRGIKYVKLVNSSYKLSDVSEMAVAELCGEIERRRAR